MRWLSVVVILLAGCLSDQLVPCGELLCPAGDQCFADQCATADQIATCRGSDDGVACNAVTNGFCWNGLCISSVCGDGIVEIGEVCDDNNQTSLDGCSADCRSRETCGNDVPDFQRGEECDRGVPGVSGDGCSSTCTVEVGEWRNVTRSKIGIGSFDSAAVFDRARNTIVLLVQRTSGGATTVETWESVGKTWRRRTPQSSPPAFSDLEVKWLMSYDVARGRTVLLATATNQTAAATWEWDGVTWQDMRPTTQPPVLGTTGISYAGMAYDEQRGETILAGFGQTWVWNGVTWAFRATATSPPMQTGDASLAYDRTRKVIVGLFGFSASETWIWNGTNWVINAGKTPPMAGSMPMTFNPVSGTVVGYGNDVTDSTNDDDVWSWNGTAWSMTTPSPALATRRHDLVFDEGAGDLVVLGGYHFIANDPSEDWRLHGTTWAQNPTVKVFSANRGAMVFDETRGAFIVFDDQFPVGAYVYDGVALSKLADVGLPPGDIAACYSEKRASTFASAGRFVVELTGATSTALPMPQTPAGIFRSVLVCDPATGWPRLVSDRATFTFDGSTWTKSTTNLALDTSGVGPELSIVLDSVRHLFVLYSGNGTNHSAVLWESADGLAWTQRESPPYRHDISLVFNPLRQSLMLYGGLDPVSPTYVNELDEWNGTAWAPLAIPGVHPPVGVTTVGFDEVHGRLAVLVSNPTPESAWELGFEPVSRDRCFATGDEDGDGLAGCLDPDCWGTCTPGCPPGTTCDPALPHCGDGVCSALEDYSRCPVDCP
ncbi:hypothetical protein BH11MYX2_BH11MYX2_34030 [soil metagenome]